MQVRAGAARTFGGLGSFLAVIFLGGGIYLLQESFTDPLRAQAVGLIAGAFIIALATILIYFIFTPRNRSQRREVHHTRVYQPLHTPARSPGVMPTSPLVPASNRELNGADQLCARNRREIAFFQYALVMQFVPGDHECQRPHADFFSAGRAATHPGRLT